MIFASLIIERENLRWQDLGLYAGSWVQNVGGYAAFGLVVWLLMRWFSPPSRASQAPVSPLQRSLFRLSLLCAVVGYVMLLVLYLPSMLSALIAVFEGSDTKGM